MKFYELTYYKLTTQCQQRGLDKTKLEGYYEKHHILPKSLGGSDLPENLVLLTAREHFIAHYLLTKFTVGESRMKMLHALAIMGNGLKSDRRLTARQYEICMKANSQAIKLAIDSGTHHWQTSEYRLAQSERTSARNKASTEAGTHYFQSSEHRQATSERNKVRNKANAELGLLWAQSPEGRRRLSISASELNKKKTTCENCGRHVSLGGYAQFHGPKCKLLTQIGYSCLLTDKPARWKSCPIDGCDYGGQGVGYITRHLKKYHNQ